MSAESDDIDELWAAVADPMRRRLLDTLLVLGAATATALAEQLPITRQAVAKHLAILTRAGLVEGRRQGREVRYVVLPEQLDAVTRWMARLAEEWDTRMVAIKRLAEAADRSSLDPTRRRPPPSRSA